MRNDNGFVSLWQMNGNQITSNLAVADPGPNYNVVGTGDFDGDGYGDALLRHDNGFIALWQMNGNQIVSNLAVAHPSPQWHVAGTGDFDGDDRTDILLRHDNGHIVLWQIRRQPDRRPTSRSAIPGRNGMSPAFGDFGGDGRSDILMRHDNGFVALLQMNGNQIVSNTGGRQSRSAMAPDRAGRLRRRRPERHARGARQRLYCAVGDDRRAHRLEPRRRHDRQRLEDRAAVL